jgi:lipoyl(octanoyl) transferase
MQGNELKLNTNLNVMDSIKSSIKKNSSSGKIPYFDLGIIRYDEAFKLQLDIFKIVKDGYVPGVLLLLEHHPVITIGNNKNRSNLISSESTLKAQQIELYQSNRGGDITFHGPGQLVCYPIFNLENFGKDLGKFVYNLEQVIIDVLASYEVRSHRINKIRGVFVNKNKIASVGIHVKKWVTIHGFSFNVSVNLEYFKNIVACGLKDYNQTSLQEILDKTISISDVKEHILKNFSKTFNIRI